MVRQELAGQIAVLRSRLLSAYFVREGCGSEIERSARGKAGAVSGEDQGRHVSGVTVYTAYGNHRKDDGPCVQDMCPAARRNGTGCGVRAGGGAAAFRGARVRCDRSDAECGGYRDLPAA